MARLQRRALKENRLDDANVEVIRARLETLQAGHTGRAELLSGHDHPPDRLHPGTHVRAFGHSPNPGSNPKPAVSDGNTTFIRKADVPRNTAVVAPGA